MNLCSLGKNLYGLTFLADKNILPLSTYFGVLAYPQVIIFEIEENLTQDQFSGISNGSKSSIQVSLPFNFS